MGINKCWEEESGVRILQYSPIFRTIVQTHMPSDIKSSKSDVSICSVKLDHFQHVVIYTYSLYGYNIKGQS